MRLLSLRLRHFRSFVDETLTLAPGTVIVGANNAGKTTIVDALSFLLRDWESDPDRLTFDRVAPAMHPEADKSPVFVTGRFADLSAAERKHWGLALDESETLWLGSFALPDGYSDEPTHPLLPPLYPFVLMPLSSVASHDKFPVDQLLVFNEFDSQTAWVDPMSFGEFFAGDTENLYLGPKLISLPGPGEAPPPLHHVLAPLAGTLIDTFDRAGKGLWINLAMAADETGSLLTARLAEAVDNLGDLGVRVVHHGMSLAPTAEELAARFVQFNVTGTGDEGHGPAGAPGAGAVRATVLAALSLYGSLDLWDRHRQSIILAIEEPEAGLHPSLQRKVARSLGQIRAQGLQTIVTTHSAIFMDSASDDGLRVLRAAPSARITEMGSVADVADVLGLRPSDALLGEHFLVVEGDTEVEVLPVWARTLGLDLGRKGIRVVSADGADAIHLLARLTSIAFPGARYTVLVDGDTKGREVARKVQRSGLPAAVRMWSRNTVEEFYSARAVNLWARYLSIRSGRPAPKVASGPVTLGDLKDLARQATGRVLEKPAAGRFVAAEMTKDEIDAEVVALLGELISDST